jgi:hypothetical protein
MKYQSRTLFVYEADLLTSLGPLSTATLQFNVHGDSDFFWQKFACFALVSDTATTRSADQLPAVGIKILNQTTGRSYTKGYISMASLAWYGQFLPLMTVWPRKSSILVYLKNFDANIIIETTYSSLQLSFIGTKAFPKVEKTASV